MNVIAIDPGYDRVGIAVLEKKNGKEKVIFSECFFSDKKQDINLRIMSIGKRVADIMHTYNPEFCAIEGLFFSKNTKTALKVAEARGVIIFQALSYDIPVYEYMPNQIKVAVVGHGGADKKDILSMVSRLVEMDDRIRIDDELDAIAIGLTFLASYR